MRTVTYILGAGASANALPVVQGMDDRMESFLKFLELQPGQVKKIWPELEGYHDILKVFRDILDNTTKHHSIDTYAKKLFLREEKEKLWYLKSFLSCYLLFEQAEFKDKPFDIKSESGARLHSISPPVTTQIDPRYDPFFAALLTGNKRNLTLPENIRIISWNYDYQLELAFMDYADCDIIGARTHLKIYPIEFDPPDDLKQEPKIVKLNGTAGEFHFTGNKSENEFQSIQQSKNNESMQFFEIFKFLELIQKRLKGEKFNKSYWPYVNFAWELNQNVISKQGVAYAKKIISQTAELVIIGYSFPIFNRSIDKEIFSGTNLNQINKVYIQDPKPAQIKQNLMGIVNNNIRKFIELEDTDQFFIPSEL